MIQFYCFVKLFEILFLSDKPRVLPEKVLTNGWAIASLSFKSIVEFEKDCSNFQ